MDPVTLSITMLLIQERHGVQADFQVNMRDILTDNLPFQYCRSTGLFLLLDVKQDESICTTESVGLRISLQNQGEAAFPETNGFYVLPGLLTSVTITRVKIVHNSFSRNAIFLKLHFQVVTTKINNCNPGLDKDEYFYDGSYTVEV